jgi:hypothetical protein
MRMIHSYVSACGADVFNLTHGLTRSRQRSVHALRFALPNGVRQVLEANQQSGMSPLLGKEAKKSPAVAGLSLRRNVEPENRTCGFDRRVGD